MKKAISLLSMLLVLALSLCACAQRELADMTSEVHEDEGYSAILWEGRTYLPYCAIAKSDCGEQIGILDGDKDDRVYEYKGHSTEEWIISSYVMDGAMLMRESTVTNIPEGLESEYAWNR